MSECVCQEASHALFTIKASFKEVGTLRYLVGGGGGAVFSKKNEAGNTILKGLATIAGDRVKGEVTLNEPGDYSKMAKLVLICRL